MLLHYLLLGIPVELYVVEVKLPVQADLILQFVLKIRQRLSLAHHRMRGAYEATNGMGMMQ